MLSSAPACLFLSKESFGAVFAGGAVRPDELAKSSFPAGWIPGSAPRPALHGGRVCQGLHLQALLHLSVLLTFPRHRENPPLLFLAPLICLRDAQSFPLNACFGLPFLWHPPLPSHNLFLGPGSVWDKGRLAVTVPPAILNDLGKALLRPDLFPMCVLALFKEPIS